MQGIVFVDYFLRILFLLSSKIGPFNNQMFITLMLSNEILYPPSSYYQDGEQDTREENEDEEKKKRRKKGGSFCQGNWVHSLLQKSESEN